MLEPILDHQEREVEVAGELIRAQEAGPSALSGGLRLEEVRTLLRGLGQRVPLEAVHYHQHVAELDKGLSIGAFFEARGDPLTICDAREGDELGVQGVARLAEAQAQDVPRIEEGGGRVPRNSLSFVDRSQR